MMLTIKKISVFLILVLPTIVWSSSSHDIDSTNFPVDWCDTRYGSPTRSTGECMCRKNCVGPRCRREQGFIWYKLIK